MFICFSEHVSDILPILIGDISSVDERSLAYFQWSYIKQNGLILLSSPYAKTSTMRGDGDVAMEHISEWT